MILSKVGLLTLSTRVFVGFIYIISSDISDAVLAQHRVHSQEMFYRPTVALALDQTPANPKQSFSAKGDRIKENRKSNQTVYHIFALFYINHYMQGI